VNLFPARTRQFIQSHPRLTAAVGLVLCYIVLFLLYWRLSLTLEKSSDDACYVLEGLDVVRGNLLLRGWTLPLDSFYTIIVPFYALGALLTRNTSILMYILPAAEYSLLVVMCIAIAWKNVIPEYRLVSVIIILLAIGCPSYPAGPPNEAAGHISTVIFITAAFYLLSTGRFLLAAVILVLADVGDPFALWIGNISIALVGLRLMVVEKWRGAKLLILTVTCVLLSKLMLLAISLGHGYKIEVGETRSAFVSLGRLGHNFYLLCESVLDLFGANFFGRQVLSLETGLILVHMVAFVFIFWALIKLISGPIDQHEIIPALLMTAIVVDIAAFLFSDIPVDIDSARFLSPVLIYGVLLVALSWYRLGIEHKYLWVVLPVMICAYLTSFGMRVAEPVAPAPTEVFSYLESKGVTDGYGGYWSAGLLTVLSNERFTVRQVVPRLGGKLGPYKWVSAADWYDMNDARFLIADRRDPAVNLSTATVTWGRPEEIKSIGRYRIFIWKGPIHLPAQ
jgi:hypothetical protein